MNSKEITRQIVGPFESTYVLTSQRHHSKVRRYIKLVLFSVILFYFNCSRGKVTLVTRENQVTFVERDRVTTSGINLYQ